MARCLLQGQRTAPTLGTLAKDHTRVGAADQPTRGLTHMHITSDTGPIREQDIRVFGGLTVIAQRNWCFTTNQWFYTIHVFGGPHRFDELSYTTFNRQDYRARYRTIRARALPVYSAAHIAATIPRTQPPPAAASPRTVDRHEEHPIGRAREEVIRARCAGPLCGRRTAPRSHRTSTTRRESSPPIPRG